MQRAAKNGFMARGSKHGKARLSEQDVLTIRKVYSTGQYLTGDIAKTFNVSSHQIGCIIRRQCWKHI